MKIKCIFGQITWYFDFKFSYKYVDFGKIFKNEIYLFWFGQSMKKIIMVNVGYFCMGQRMMWNNFVNLSLSFINKLNFVNYITKWKKLVDTQ